METCDINNRQDEFVNFFMENDNFPKVECDDPKYGNYILITSLLRTLRVFDELDYKDDMFEYIDDFINHDKNPEINTYLKRFFEIFKEFFNKLYHDVCYSEYDYIHNNVYGEAYYSIDKDFILNKKYKNEYIEYADMYDILLKVVPSEYVDLIFEDFLYTVLHNMGLDYDRKVIDKDIHYQISYSSRIVKYCREYLKEMIGKFGEEDISNEPDLKDYIKSKLEGYNEFVTIDKEKQLKRY